MLILQQRIRDLLLTDPWFAAPVQVFIEDRAGLQFMLDKALKPMAAPSVIVMTAAGERGTGATGILNLTERVNLYFLATPLMDKTGLDLLSGVEAAMRVLHEALLWPESAPAQGGGARIRVIGHGVIEGASPTQLAHEVRLEMPVSFRPATPAGNAPNR